MNRCLICFGRVESSLNNLKVCNKCLAKFKVINKCFQLEGCEVVILYEYNDFFKDLLYRYKGCYDLSLKEAFLNNYLKVLKKKYKGRKIVCAPSSLSDDRVRGFNHVKEIAKLFDMEIIDCLSKNGDYKQSAQQYNNRGDIQNIIKVDKSKINVKDPILIFDDVTTSLSTIKAIIHLLTTNNDKKVFILASNCRFMENEKI